MVPMEDNKDVTVHVTGVSMSGESGLKDDAGRHTEEDKIRVIDSEESDSK